MKIPNNIISLARRNAQLSRSIIHIYKFHDTFVMMPKGYAIPNEAVLVGYITQDLAFHESGDEDETTEERSVNSN